MLIQNSEKSPEVFKNQELSELLGCSLCQLYSERLAALAKHRPRIFLQVFPGLISGTDLHRRTCAVPTVPVQTMWYQNTTNQCTCVVTADPGH